MQLQRAVLDAAIAQAQAQAQAHPTTMLQAHSFKLGSPAVLSSPTVVTRSAFWAIMTGPLSSTLWSLYRWLQVVHVADPVPGPVSPVKALK